MFRNQWDMIIEDKFVEPKSNKPTACEDCARYSISDLLKRLTRDDVDAILGFSGGYSDVNPDKPDLKQCVTDLDATEKDLLGNEQLDLNDIYEVENRKIELFKEQVKMSAGVANSERSPADTILSDSVQNENSQSHTVTAKPSDSAEV